MSDIFPCLGIVGSLTVIFGFLAFLRYMNYKETIALAEKGLTKPEPNRTKTFALGDTRHGTRTRTHDWTLLHRLYLCRQLPASSRTVDAGRLRPAFSWPGPGPASLSDRERITFYEDNLP